MLSAVSVVISVVALCVSGFVAVTQFLDRRRAQAELVAGWCKWDDDGRGFHSVLSNASSQPIYDVLFVIRTNDEMDFGEPAFLGVVPPGDLPAGAYRFEEGENVEQPNLRPFITFRDARGRAWMRDTHGRLQATKRPVDEAPRPNIAGRIERG